MGCGCGCGCRQNCGCNGNTTTLSGTVRDSLGGPVSGLTIQYTVNGVSHTTTTDANGRYTISAPRGAMVVITPQPGLGVTVTPTSRTVTACQAQTNLDFTVGPLTPPTPFTVSGTLTGLGTVAGLPVQYSINGQTALAFTDALGNYSFAAPAGANILITPPAFADFTVTPPMFMLNNLAMNMPGQNFAYTGND